MLYWERIKKLLKITIGILLIIAGFTGLIYIRFTNIDITEMQLFIEFWYYWLLIIISIFIGSKLLIKALLKGKKQN